MAIIKDGYIYLTNSIYYSYSQLFLMKLQVKSPNVSSFCLFSDEHHVFLYPYHAHTDQVFVQLCIVVFSHV